MLCKLNSASDLQQMKSKCHHPPGDTAVPTFLFPGVGKGKDPRESDVYVLSRLNLMLPASESSKPASLLASLRLSVTRLSASSCSC